MEVVREVLRPLNFRTFLIYLEQTIVVNFGKEKCLIEWWWKVVIRLITLIYQSNTTALHHQPSRMRIRGSIKSRASVSYSVTQDQWCTHYLKTGHRPRGRGIVNICVRHAKCNMNFIINSFAEEGLGTVASQPSVHHCSELTSKVVGFLLLKQQLSFRSPSWFLCSFLVLVSAVISSGPNSDTIFSSISKT